MRAAALCHAEMTGELIALRPTVSSTLEQVLGCSPNETFRVEVMDELVAKFQRLEELCSRLEGPTVRICDLLLEPLPSQAQWPDRLGEATRRLEAELATQRQVEAELEALWTSATRVQDLVLRNTNILSSLAVSLYMGAELHEARIDTTATNGVRWGNRSVLVAALSHFLELKTKLELLGSGRSWWVGLGLTGIVRSFLGSP
jgi:hypothetical protein